MAYEKQTWVTGETITANKLNHMEEGIMESGGGSGSNLVILPFTRAGNTIVTTLTYSDITDVYAKYQSGDAVALTIDMGNERATLFVTSILYNSASYGNPEEYVVEAAGIYSLADPNNTYVYLVDVTFKNGAETTANVTVKRIPLTD